jgi:hypothetical protein
MLKLKHGENGTNLKIKIKIYTMIFKHNIYLYYTNL